MSQMMGNLFYRRQQIDVIRSLGFAEMKYWNNWHEMMSKEEEKAYQKAKGKNA